MVGEWKEYVSELIKCQISLIILFVNETHLYDSSTILNCVCVLFSRYYCEGCNSLKKMCGIDASDSVFCSLYVFSAGGTLCTTVDPHP